MSRLSRGFLFTFRLETTMKNGNNIEVMGKKGTALIMRA